jgi:hypothetical protein
MPGAHCSPLSASLLVDACLQLYRKVCVQKLIFFLSATVCVKKTFVLHCTLNASGGTGCTQFGDKFVAATCKTFLYGTNPETSAA